MWKRRFIMLMVSIGAFGVLVGLIIHDRASRPAAPRDDAGAPGRPTPEASQIEPESPGQGKEGWNRALLVGPEELLNDYTAGQEEPEPPRGTICGLVLGAGEERLSARIRVEQDGRPAGEACAARDGHFTVFGLPEGSYDIRVLPRDKRYAPKQVTGIRTGTSPTIRLSFDESVGRLLIRSAQPAEPLDGVHVQCARGAAHVAQAPKGGFRTAVIPPGTYRVYALRAGLYEERSVVVEAGADTSVSMEPAASGTTLCVEAITAQSLPVPGAEVRLDRANSEEGASGKSSPWMAHPRKKTDSHGTAKFRGLPPGRYEAVVRLRTADEELLASAKPQAVDVRGNECKVTIHMELPRVLVLGAAPARDSLYVEAYSEAQRRWWTGNVSRDGRFAITGLPPGRAKLSLIDRNSEDNRILQTAWCDVPEKGLAVVEFRCGIERR